MDFNCEGPISYCDEPCEEMETLTFIPARPIQDGFPISPECLQADARPSYGPGQGETNATTCKADTFYF